MASNKNRALLTLEYLKFRIHYDPITGIFTWLAREVTHRCHVTWNTRFVGTRADYVDAHGYVQISLDGVKHKGHRLAWFYMTEEWIDEIDHENLIRHDNIWENLREADRSKNGCNKRVRSDSQTGVKGVYLCRKPLAKPYSVKISVNKQKFYLGYFATLEEAAAAHADEARRLHGEFARVA